MIRTVIRAPALTALGLAVLGLAGLGLADLAPAARAQSEAPKAPTSAKEIEKSERESELKVLRRDLRSVRERENKIKSEIEAIRNDRVKFEQEMLATAGRIRDLESKMAAAEARLEPLDVREAEIKKSLDDRRALLSSVLAALQKIGIRPAPALVLRPEDALRSVRSAILLGAIVPELRAEAQKLADDLAELARVRREIAAERAQLAQHRAALEEDHSRISALIAERQRQYGEHEKSRQAEHARAQALARKADSVQELVTRMEQEIAKDAEDARREAERARLPFAEARGKLPLPATGSIVRNFGVANDAGGNEKGISLATPANAQVSAPCAGHVVFAGTFSNYGQLLIINAGGGYHILLAGMAKITVDLGQSVVMGEPVAIMGGGPPTAAVPAPGFSEPILYIEFRRNGDSIDPAPWWAATEEKKVRG